jgi:hypothetical protein
LESAIAGLSLNSGFFLPQAPVAFIEMPEFDTIQRSISGKRNFGA